MSPKTVEAHLARIYRKLGIRSRAELGALLEPAPGRPCLTTRDQPVGTVIPPGPH
jgi:hypothetical protein